MSNDSITSTKMSLVSVDSADSVDSEKQNHGSLQRWSTVLQRIAAWGGSRVVVTAVMEHRDGVPPTRRPTRLRRSYASLLKKARVLVDSPAEATENTETDSPYTLCYLLENDALIYRINS